MRSLLFIYFIVVSSYAQYLPIGHSHNDYLQKRPLYTAIENGFASIEIDLYLWKDSLLKVSHFPIGLSKKKTIEEMYFKPIESLILKKDSVFIYSQSQPLTLMIDIKSDGNKTYGFLHPILKKYQSYITTYTKSGDIIQHSYLKILISGNKPSIEKLAQDDIVFAKLDVSIPSSFTDCSLDSLGQYIHPFIERRSSKYKRFFKSNPTKNDSIKLRCIVKNGDALKQELRFYAAGNTKTKWMFLMNFGVDWINVDDIEKFKEFYWTEKANTH